MIHLTMKKNTYHVSEFENYPELHERSQIQQKTTPFNDYFMWDLINSRKNGKNYTFLVPVLKIYMYIFTTAS